MPSQREYDEYHAKLVLPDGMAHNLEHGYNRLRDQALHELRDGALTVLGSGFGKGVLAVAATALIGGALAMGGLAVAGIVVTGAGGPIGLLGGMTGGLHMGLSFLTSGLGLGLMGGVGAAKAAQDWQEQKHAVADAMALAQARQQAKHKPQEPQHAPAQEHEHEPEQTTFRDRHPPREQVADYRAEEQRRALARTDDHHGIMGVA